MRGLGVCYWDTGKGQKSIQNSRRPTCYPYNSLFPSRLTEFDKIELRPDLYVLAPPTRARTAGANKDTEACGSRPRILVGRPPRETNVYSSIDAPSKFRNQTTGSLE